MSGSRVSVSEAESFEPFGSVIPPGGATVAVLTRFTRKLDGMVITSVKFALPPTRRSTLSAIAPEPEAAQLDPTEATQLQLVVVIPVGSGSATAAPTTALGPALLTVIVYVVVVPGS